jgi:hypothetical protein
VQKNFKQKEASLSRAGGSEKTDESQFENYREKPTFRINIHNKTVPEKMQGMNLGLIYSSVSFFHYKCLFDSAGAMGWPTVGLRLNSSATAI